MHHFALYAGQTCRRSVIVADASEDDSDVSIPQMHDMACHSHRGCCIVESDTRMFTVCVDALTRTIIEGFAATVIYASIPFININMPIAFALGIAAATAILFDDVLPINSIVTRAFVGVDSSTLLAVPFFIIAGELMNANGIPSGSSPLPVRGSVTFAVDLPRCRSCRACSFRGFPDQQPWMLRKSGR
jgi:hypothetical protein